MNSKQHGRKGKRPIFWVPESFHPENTLPPRLLPHCQSAYYLMHAIIVRVAFGDRDAAHLKMEHLRNVMGREYGRILNALLDSGDMQRIGNFIERIRCFGYLPAPKYKKQKLRQVRPTDPRLMERLEKVHADIEAEKQRYCGPIHDVWQRWQTHLCVDIRQARTIIAQLPVESNPYHIQTLLVERIRFRQHRFTVDAYGRVHNSITSLHRTLRPALRIQRQPLASLDIVNSQPGLLALLIHQHQPGDLGTDQGHPSPPSIYDVRQNPPTRGVYWVQTAGHDRPPVRAPDGQNWAVQSRREVGAAA